MITSYYKDYYIPFFFIEDPLKGEGGGDFAQ